MNSMWKAVLPSVSRLSSWRSLAIRRVKMAFDDDKIYDIDDPLLSQFVAPATLRNWRSQGRGPAYLKISPRSKIRYPGKALNEWLEACTIRPDRP